MGGKGKTAPAETRVLSVRVPVNEAELIDADARKAGMSRNDFMLKKIREQNSFANAKEIILLIEVFRQLTIMLDTYLGILDRYVGLLDEGERNASEVVLAEINRAQDLMRLTFKAQRQAVRALRSTGASDRG